MKHKVGDTVRIIADNSWHYIPINTEVIISAINNRAYIVRCNSSVRFFTENDCESIETTSQENNIKEIFIQKELLEIAQTEIEKLKQKNKVLLNILKSHGINVEAHE